jgi:hypothetical protein
MGLALLLVAAGTAAAQGALQFTVPGVSIGINVPAYPQLVPVPGYPVYYAPELDTNFFFYDGLYWLYVDDRWYASEWYDGPWGFVEPESVPYYVLRIPVNYYRRPPPYFREWDRRAPPRWGEHWGRDWEQRHRDWNEWNHGSRPPRAPPPEYQRKYPRDHYPAPDQQQPLRDRDYHFRPREPQDRHLLTGPSDPQHGMDRRSQENRRETAPGLPDRQPAAEQHRRTAPSPAQKDRSGIATPPPRSANVPQPQRKEEPALRHDTPGAQRLPQNQ